MSLLIHWGLFHRDFSNTNVRRMTIESIADIQFLIDNSVEESTELEYKRSFAKANPKWKEELAKDISAMANANGGIFIYGLAEKNVSNGLSLPELITPIPSTEMTKDQLSQLLSSNITPKINNIEISVLPQEGGNVFILHVPKGITAHQNKINHLYYIRRNATVEVMEDYEIRDVMNRQSNSPLEIDGCGLYKTKNDPYSNKVEYTFMAKIQNVGHSVCEVYKLNVYFNKISLHCDFSFPSKENFSYTALDAERLKISCRYQEPIFGGETLEMGHFVLHIDKDHEEEFLDGLIIDMILFYPGGSCDVAFIPSEQRYVEGRDKINTLLGRDKRIDYPILEVDSFKKIEKN